MAVVLRPRCLFTRPPATRCPAAQVSLRSYEAIIMGLKKPIGGRALKSSLAWWKVTSELR